MNFNLKNVIIFHMFKPAVALFQDSGIFFRILDLFLRVRGEGWGARLMVRVWGWESHPHRHPQEYWKIFRLNLCVTRNGSRMPLRILESWNRATFRSSHYNALLKTMSYCGSNLFKKNALDCNNQSNVEIVYNAAKC